LGMARLIKKIKAIRKAIFCPLDQLVAVTAVVVDIYLLFE